MRDRRNGHGDRRDLRQSCRRLCRRVAARTGNPSAAADRVRQHSGGVTVLPRSEKPPAGWRTLRSQNVALIELQESLDDYLNGLNSSCFTASAATAFTRQQLARLGFVGWTIDVRSPQGSASPICTGSGIVDPTTATVRLISGRFGNPAAEPAGTPRNQPPSPHQDLPGPASDVQRRRTRG